MSEALKVAQHKVTSTQTQVDELEEANEKKRVELEQISHQIFQEEQLQSVGRNKFEDHLAGLISCFSEAKAFYSVANITGAMELTEEGSLSLHQRRGTIQQEEADLARKLGDLQLKKGELHCLY